MAAITDFLEKLQSYVGDLFVFVEGGGCVNGVYNGVTRKDEGKTTEQVILHLGETNIPFSNIDLITSPTTEIIYDRKE